MTVTSEDITICIPVFERDEYFYDAVNSAINQNIKSNILVIDNCSSHNRFADFCIKNNINYIRNNENIGMVGNWNKCIGSAKTKWVTILHDDDLLYPNYNEIVLKILNSDKNEENTIAIAVDVLVGNRLPLFVSNRNSYDTYQVTRLDFLKYGLTPFPGVLLNKEKTLSIGGFNKLFHPISDFDLWYRIINAGKVIKCTIIQAFYRVSEHQASNKNAQEMVDKTYHYRIKLIKTREEREIAKLATLNLLDYYEKTYNLKLKLPYFSLVKEKRKIKSFIKKLYRIKWIKVFP